MAKSTNLYVRIEPEVKEQAEKILSTLGISSSSAINMFYKQIILKRGIPFDVVIPDNYLIDIGKMTQNEIDYELAKGWDSMQKGKGKEAREVFADLHEKYGL